MDRRLFLAGSAALAACSQTTPTAPSTGKRMALTMDDFAQSFEIGLSLKERNDNILEAFDAVGHKAAGFVTGSFVDSPWGETVLQSWRKRGHLIENHTWSHPHADTTDTDAYRRDIARTSIHLLAQGEPPTYFRFPFLDDGKDRAQQEALFRGLADLTLINAPVTLDTVDWFTSSRLEAKLRDDPKTDLAPYRAYYVDMCVTLAEHWHGVATALGYENLPHLTLVHHNVLNGFFLKDVLLALKAKGWSFVDAEEALAHMPYHALPPEPTRGRNWLTLKSREAGITTAPYPKEYLQFGKATMDALGL